jgi:SPP1 gp7 family putative phage head morphogenesis protein
LSELNLNNVDKITSRLEKGYVDTLTVAYKDSLKTIKQEIADIYMKYGEDGVLKPEVMSKYGRLQTLEKTLNEELAHLNRGRPQQLDAYLKQVYEANYTNTGQAINTLTDSAIKFDLINQDAVVKAITRPMQKIALQSNADAVRLNIKRAVTQGVVQGQPIKQMADNIQKVLETNLNNAVRIARTETAGVMGNARQDAFTLAQENGLEFKKKWVSASDDRTRDTHLALNGEIVDNDKPFSNGLMYPADQSGDASEVINCRCRMVAVFND